MSGPGLDRRPALDGLRGVAILSVLAYHLGLPGTTGGFLGVDVFFVLSGFLIGSLLDGEFSTSGRIDLVRFWSRRARRLLPALVVVAIAVAVWTHLQADWSTWALRRDDLLATLGYVANWHLVAIGSDYFAATSGASPLLHTWSLAVEEQFYLLWPLAFLLAAVIGRRLAARYGIDRRVVPIAFASVIALASVVLIALAFDPASPSRAYYGTDTRIHQILVGVVLGLLVRPWRPRPSIPASRRRLLGLAQIPVALVLLAGFVFVDATSPLYYSGGSFGIALLVAAIIYTVENAPEGPVARVLSMRPLVFAGIISYGLYLWHWPVIVATAPADPSAGTLGLIPLRLVLSFGLAVVMYVVIERPILEGRLPVVRRSSWRTLAAAAAAIVFAVSFSMQATDLAAAARAAEDSASVAAVDVPGDSPADAATDGLTAASDGSTPGASGAAGPSSSAGSGTPGPARTAAPTPSLAPAAKARGQAEVAAAVADFAHWQCPSDSQICTKAQGRPGALTVVLYGDSSIGSLDVGMTEWAQKTGVTYVLAASGGCSASGQPRSNDPTRVVKGPMDGKCEKRYQAIVDQVAALPGPLLVLVSSVSENRAVVLPDGSVAAFGADAQSDAVRSGLEHLIKRLDRKDATVVLLGPAGHTLDPKCEAFGSGDCALAPLAADWAAQDAISQLYAAVAAEHPGLVRFIKLDTIVCPQGGPCTPWQGDTLLRWDGIHYTRPGSRIVSAAIIDRLKQAGIPLP